MWFPWEFTSKIAFPSAPWVAEGYRILMFNRIIADRDEGSCGMAREAVLKGINLPGEGGQVL